MLLVVETHIKTIVIASFMRLVGSFSVMSDDVSYENS